MAHELRQGGIARCEVVFRNSDTNARQTPASCTVEVYPPSVVNEADGPATAWTEADPEVNLGLPLALDLAADLLDEGEANDGTGSAQALVPLAESGDYRVYFLDPTGGTYTCRFNVKAKTDR